MSTAVSSGVWACGPADSTAKFLLLAIADNADDFGFAFPSQATLAAKIAVDVRTVQRYLDVLESEGWLRIGRKLIDGKCSAYFIDLGKIGVTLSPDARKSSMFVRLERQSHDKLSRIFLPKKSHDRREISGDNPQPPHTTKRRSHATRRGTHTTETGGSHDTAMPPKPLEPSRVEPSATEPSGEPSTEVELPPTPLVGGGISPDEEIAWNSLKRAMERALRSNLPAGLEAHRFQPLRPGENDWRVAFDAWWLRERRIVAGMLTFFTDSHDPSATRAGIAKYERRLAHAARQYFALGPHTPVAFVVRDNETLNPAA